MVAQFQVLRDRVVVNEYSEPLSTADIEQMTKEISVYAAQQSQPVYVISDFSQIKHFPATLLTLGLRRNQENPVRNPKIAAIVVVADSPLLNSLAEVVTKVAHVEKFVVVRTREAALLEIDKLMLKHDGEK